MESICNLRVADLSCGTGTLLLAAAREMERLHRNARGHNSLAPEAEALHKILIEDVLHGYDVELTAIHLAAAHLGLLAPDVGFDNMNLFVLPCEVNGGGMQLGSADSYLADARTAEIDGEAELYWTQADSAPWKRTRFAPPRMADDAEQVAENPNLRALGEFAEIGLRPRHPRPPHPRNPAPPHRSRTFRSRPPTPPLKNFRKKNA